MEKKVTGIDLDELKRAREEMMAEKGMTPSYAGSSETQQSYKHTEEIDEQEPTEFSQPEKTDYPDESAELNSDDELLEMIDNFIANVEDTEDGLVSKPQEVEENEDKVASKSESSQQSDAQSQLTSSEAEVKQPTQNPNQNTKRNLSQYDAFAQYEINAPKVQSHDAQSLQEIEQSEQDEDLIIEEASENMLESFDDKSAIEDNKGYDNAQVDNVSQKLNANDEDEILDSLELEIEESQETQEQTDFKEVEHLEDINVKTEKVDNSALDKTVSAQDVFNNMSNGEDIDDESEDNNIDDFDFFNLSENKEQNLEEQTTPEPELNLTDEIQDDEILNELKKQKQIEAENSAYIHVSPQYEVVQNKPDFLPEIDPVSFVNVLSMQEFKNSDNFTFVLGRSESGNVLFETLKNCYNIAFFANENSYELLNTMLLSFMLKNSPNEFKLALCDGADSNNFIYYSQSKYLFGGSIAKTEDEIMQKLTSISTELEARYHTLAKFNVRSVEEYNILAKNTNTPKLSQILIVIDGYYELMHSSNFEKIKNCLYQILRLGRIAGIYVVVVTSQIIEEDIINFNLPSRIGFKCNENDDSISMIGESGIDKLSNKNEFLYSSINQESAQHIRQPMVSDAIIKILIDNIEK